MNTWLFTIPFISALTGWIINRLAVKSLFYPQLPKKILGFTFQGIFPKRQKQFAEKLGKLAVRALISFDEIEGRIASPENLKKILPFVEGHIDIFLREKLGERMPMLKMFIGDKIVEQMKEVFMQELEQLFPLIMSNYLNTLKTDINLESIIIKKVANLSTDRLEDMLHQILQKELKSIEIYGLLLGFLIGLSQLFITILAS